MTRYSLCATTHYLAARRAGLGEEESLAAGVAIATAIAVFKNRAYSQPKKRFPATTEPKSEPIPETTPETTPEALPTTRIGGFDLLIEPAPLGVVQATVVLGGRRTTLKGNSMKGRHEVAKVPPIVVAELERRLEGVEPTSRKVFDVYRSVRDELGL